MIRQVLERYVGDIGLSLTAEDLRLFEQFAVELKKWNTKVNLTAITVDDEIAAKHFLDSLHLAPHVKDGDYLLDIGSGAGFPVLPLKMVKPETRMMSVDAVAKKINFQRHIIRLFRLQRIEALHTRAEDLYQSHAQKFTLITSRAFTRLDQFVEIAAPLLAPEGRLIAMKGAGAGSEIREGHSAIQERGFVVTSTYPYSLPAGMGKRCLTVVMPCKAP